MNRSTQKLTVDELTNKFVGLDIMSRSYNATKKEYRMIIEPSIGIKPEYIGKRFKVTFINCAYVSEYGKALNTSSSSDLSGDISNWGKDYDKTYGMGIKLDKAKTAILKSINTKNKSKYTMYFFLGLSYIDILILCEETKAEEIT